MTFNVSRALKQPGTPFPLDVEQAIAPQEVGGETVTFEPARLKGSFMAVDNGKVELRGVLTARAHAHCANCLAPAEAAVEEAFDEIFEPGEDTGDPEVFTYTGQEIDPERLAMSTAVLGLPPRFLCREDCDGQPDYIDADVEVCLCQKELPGQRPFAALKQLLAEAGKNAD